MSRRKQIKSRDDAERVANRVRRDTEALFAAVGGEDSPIWKDEIIRLNELKNIADLVWQKLVRRNELRPAPTERETK